MASSSSSLPSRPHRDYDVFVSFRGEDTRRTFVSHLFNALKYKGLKFFRDDVSMERGKSISPELSKAIQSSTYAVIVFSKNYVSSSWCLEELVTIMKCRNDSGQIVLPVFYDVDPSDVRKGRGSFFELNENDKKQRMTVGEHTEREQVWRAALAEAASIAGLELENTANGDEAAFIEEIVQKISSDLYHHNPYEDENLVGMRTRVGELLLSLDIASDDVRMIGICGMGGAGKTTVARSVYDEISYLFDGISFVESLRHEGIKHALQKVLSDLLKEKDFKVGGVIEGIKMMKERFRGRRVLIVLDDVDHKDQLRALAGDHSWFGPKSRIIMTTRDKQLMVKHKVNKCHEVHFLNEEEAIQLFSRYAFEQNVPPKEYQKLSNDAVRYADGLPLALKVLGSFLYGKEMDDWETTLARLELLPENEIHDILKISYDSLQDIHKQTFLDIACLFRGWSKDEVMDILDACDFHPKEGLKVLEQRSLITSSNGKFEMHDLIREMARRIVQGKHPQEPEKHSRVWETENLVQLFTGDTQEDTQEVKGKAVEALVGDFFEHYVNFTVSIKMKKLRLIDFGGCDDCVGSPTSLPSGLRWMSWYSYPGYSLPTTFQAQNLVCLDLSCSEIVRLWKGYKSLPSLKTLKLSHSERLIRTPDFTGTPNLTTLDLSECSALVKVHASIGYLDKLISLDLTDCARLTYFPPIVEMNSLEIFSLDCCVGIRKFPEVKGNLGRLRDLNLQAMNIEELPTLLWKAKHLEKLDLSWCDQLKKLHYDDMDVEECSVELPVTGGLNTKSLPWILLLKNLTSLSLSRCEMLREDLKVLLSHISLLISLRSLDLGYCGLLDGDIPSDIGTLSCLEVLELSDNKFSLLPNSLSNLSRLSYLGLSCCTSLKVLPELPYKLNGLDVARCKSLTSIAGITTREWLLRASFWGSTELLKNENFIREADLLLQSMLKGASVDNFYRSVIFPGTPEQWRSIIRSPASGNKFLLQLPPNWFEDFSGLSMYVLGSLYQCHNIDITVKPLSEHKAESHSLTDYRIEDPHVWFGYIPFSCFPLHASLKTSNYFLVTFSSLGYVPIERCGVELIPKNYPSSYSRLHTYENLAGRVSEFGEIVFNIQSWGKSTLPFAD